MRRQLFGLALISCAACSPNDAGSNDTTSDSMASDSSGDSESTTEGTETGDAGGNECESGLLCGEPAMCCAQSEVCFQGSCAEACVGGTYCGDGCCGADEVCLADTCEPFGAECSDSFDCEADEFCEPTLGVCLPQPEDGPSCTTVPQSPAFEPVIEWEWTGSEIQPDYDQVLSMPLVADLQGDETPEVVIVTHETGDGACDTGHAYLRALEGDSGTELWGANVDAYSDAGRVALCRTPAVADIDGDDSVDIVAHRFGGGLIAFEADGSIKWTSTLDDGLTPYSGYFAGLSSISIADLDADGAPEIVSAGVILDSSGSVISGVGRETFGANGVFGGHSIVADVDEDGQQEVVGGAQAIEADGTVVWSNGASDGYPAIADFDGDELPELVVISGNFARVHDAGTGNLIASLDMPGVGAGGPPTVDDFDGDGVLDFASAVGDSFTIFTFSDETIDVLWSVPTLDVSSSRTGSSIFDFEGDGAAEVLYNDECYMRVYDGTTGDVLLEFASSSGTAAQYPIAVDVDGDNNTELVVVSDDWYQLSGLTPDCPDYEDGETLRHGVFVYGDSSDRWVSTRKIWNQHTYHITNIQADGGVPSPETDSWSAGANNTYRVSSPGNGTFNAVDLQVDLAATLASCPQGVGLQATVRNEGSLGVAAGVQVEFFLGQDETGELLSATQTTQPLLPGQSEVVEIEAEIGDEAADFFVRVDGEDPGDVEECLEDNNTASLGDVSCPQIG